MPLTGALSFFPSLHSNILIVTPTEYSGKIHVERLLEGPNVLPTKMSNFGKD